MTHDLLESVLTNLQYIANTFDINTIESKCKTMEQIECPVVHSFGPGIYIREVKLSKGSFCIGHRQKFKHTNILLRGEVLMINQDGTSSTLTAPMLFTGEPGRKMGYIIKDVVWLNIYPTDETDIEVLESTYLEKSDIWKDKVHIDRAADQEDYKRLLDELCIPTEVVAEQVQNKDDQTTMPYGSFKIGIFESDIEGRGVFATADIDVGEIIGPARLEGKRTPIGRFTNHAMHPNAKMIIVGNDIYLAATTKITGCKGGQIGEEITTNYELNIKLARSISCQQ